MMEGLIPLVFKAIKKSHTRRQYECLSSAAAQTYNIADFYVNDPYHHSSNEGYVKGSAENNAAEDRQGSSRSHRRYKSVDQDFSNGFSQMNQSPTIGASASPGKKQLVRFRSHRMFSCVTGA